MENTVDIFKDYETPVSWKKSVPGVLLTAGIVNRVRVTLKDNPNAAPYADNLPVTFTASLRVLPFMDQVKLDLDGGVVTDNKYLDLIIDLPPQAQRGYYVILICLFNEEGKTVDVYNLYAAIEKSSEPRADSYMTISSIREQLGDLAASDNKLLESLEFSAGDVISAVERVIEQWNNRAPRTSTYAGHTFPYPEVLRTGTIYMMLTSLWTLLERNRMAYQSGGVNVDLERRADAFNNLKKEYQTLWYGAMSQAKNAENIGSFTGHRYYW